MAPQLWFRGQGEAVPHESKPDADGGLTAPGRGRAALAGSGLRARRQSEAAGIALAALNVEFAACYTSPKLRAVETAELACAHLNIEPEHTQALGGPFSREDALELLLPHDADARVLAVGHEPAFSQVVHDLTGGRVDFKKGGVAAVRVERC